jgi:hypothetical protein
VLGFHRRFDTLGSGLAPAPRDSGSGNLVPGTIPWTQEEDELVWTLPAGKAAKRTGRNLSALSARRKRLRVSDKEDQGAREK